MRNKRFIVVLLIYLMAASLQSLVLPIMEGNDEIIHTAYVEILRAGNQNRKSIQ